MKEVGDPTSWDRKNLMGGWEHCKIEGQDGKLYLEKHNFTGTQAGRTAFKLKPEGKNEAAEAGET